MWKKGVITRWLKAVGDTVEADELLLEVATEMVDTEIPAPCAGVIRELLAEENSTVAVGEPLAIIEPADGTPAETQQTPEASPAEPAPPAPPAADAEPARPADVDAAHSDKAAAEDQAPARPAPAQQPTTPATVTVESVSAAAVDKPPPAPARAATAAPATGKPEKMTRLRQTIAKRWWSRCTSLLN